MEEKALIIQEIYRSRGSLPGYVELGHRLGMNDNQVSKLMTKLTRYGFLHKNPQGRLVPTFDARSLRLVKRLS